MTNIFFATDEDLVEVWKWLFEVPSMRIVEDYSLPDTPNRWMQTLEEISNHVANGNRNLAAWPAEVGGRPREENVIFNSKTQRKSGALGRTVLHSPAFIKVGRNNDQCGCLANASIGYWTEKGARQRSIFPEEFINEVDWRSFRSIVGAIQRRIKKTSPAKLRSYPIMPCAFERLVAGEIRLWNWGQECSYPSPLISLV